jgi:hypothetical protein
VVEHLPGKCETPSSSPILLKNKEGEEGNHILRIQNEAWKKEKFHQEIKFLFEELSSISFSLHFEALGVSPRASVLAIYLSHTPSTSVFYFVFEIACC